MRPDSSTPNPTFPIPCTRTPGVIHPCDPSAHAGAAPSRLKTRIRWTLFCTRQSNAPESESVAESVKIAFLVDQAFGCNRVYFRTVRSVLKRSEVQRNFGFGDLFPRTMFPRFPSNSNSDHFHDKGTYHDSEGNAETPMI